jgi:DOPA 4,5-dioxygenase
MSEPLPVDLIASYHAHVYYDPAVTRDRAERLRERVGQRFTVRLGRWYDQPIGPHGQSMFQIAFRKELYGALVPWLMLNRDGLSILVHPNTDNQRADHLQRGLWLGSPVRIYGERLPEGRLEDDEQEPNTSPHLRP